MTNTDICDMALSFLSKGSVKSMTEENTEEARQCRTHYENCRRLLLRSYPWGFARRKVQLALLDARFPGWRFVYRYPGKCLNIAYVYDEAQAYARIAQKQRFETALMDAESRVVLTDVEDAWAEYGYDVTDVDLFPPEFAEALAHKLASAMALALAGSEALMQREYQLFQGMLEAAKSQDAQEKERKLVWETAYAKARFS